MFTPVPFCTTYHTLAIPRRPAMQLYETRGSMSKGKQKWRIPNSDGGPPICKRQQRGFGVEVEESEVVVVREDGVVREDVRQQ
jgi:hypothetical protein